MTNTAGSSQENSVSLMILEENIDGEKKTDDHKNDGGEHAGDDTQLDMTAMSLFPDVFDLDQHQGSNSAATTEITPAVDSTTANTSQNGDLKNRDYSINRYEREASLLMHYLDHVFPLQFPCYSPSILDGGRNWLLPLLTSAKHVYYATLSVGAQHLQITLAKSTQEHTELIEQYANDQEAHYRTAFQHLKQDGHLDNLLSAERKASYGAMELTHVSMCVLQSIYYEVLVVFFNQILLETNQAAKNQKVRMSTTGLGKRDDHSRMISTLSFLLVNMYKDSISGSGNNRQEQKQSLCFESVRALQFLTGVFVYLDILTNAGLSKPRCDIDYTQILKGNKPEGVIQLDQITGCRNEVMLLIVQILNLQRWKHHASLQKELSIRELAMRAKGIEDELLKHLTCFSHNNTSSGPRRDKSRSAQVIDEITLIFACSAISYLHVVVSGLQPSLPEIRSSVAQTITAIGKLSDKTMLGSNLVWPICITGCLVNKDQERFFRLLQSRVMDDHLSRYSAALQIMESTWAGRDKDDDSLIRDGWVAVFKDHSTSLLTV